MERKKKEKTHFYVWKFFEIDVKATNKSKWIDSNLIKYLRIMINIVENVVFDDFMWLCVGDDIVK